MCWRKSGCGHALCGNSALTAWVIKWAKLDSSGFGMKCTELWFLSGLGWDRSWRWDYIRGKCTTHHRLRSSSPRGEKMVWWLMHHIVLDVAGFGTRHMVTVLMEHAQGNDALAHRSSPLPNGVDRPVCGGQKPRLSWDTGSSPNQKEVSLSVMKYVRNDRLWQCEKSVVLYKLVVFTD